METRYLITGLTLETYEDGQPTKVHEFKSLNSFIEYVALVSPDINAVQETLLDFAETIKVAANARRELYKHLAKHGLTTGSRKEDVRLVPVTTRRGRLLKQK